MNRRESLLALLKQAEEPLSGSFLATHFGVTRQVIVRDVALLRAEGARVVSTPKGYVLQKEEKLGVEDTVTVCHSRDEIFAELCCIVDRGGRALTTIVMHPAYGELEEVLNVGSRREIEGFLERIQDSAPLLALTGGEHRHRIWAPNETVLAEIKQALRKKGYLIS